MENIFDKLQFVRGLNPNKENGVFDTREDAYNYVLSKHLVERPSLVAEPIVLLYESSDNAKGPNVILAIGSVGNGTANQANRTFFIDFQKTEEEILALDEKLEEAIKSLTLVPIESDTIDLKSEKTENGTLLSGDVKIADYRIVSGSVNENIIETEGDKGIYAFVDMDYDPETFVITFKTTKVSKEFQLPKDQHVENGWYDPKDESIYLKLADGSKIKILVTKLIEEWTVLEYGSSTPITLFKEHVSAITEGHEGLYEWQDVLTADVRVADHIGDNILHKDASGQYLYVKGTADNIKYKDGLTVKEALDNVDTKVSTSTGNLIYKRADGIYAHAMLDYNTAENKLIYTYSDENTKGNKTVEFQLNSVKILDDITYDPVKEVIVIRYIDAQGEYKTVEIPAKDIIEEWTVNNEAHNIELNKYRSSGSGKDILSADAKIYNGDDNILVDKNHELYVKGTADNIRYNNSTVKTELDSLNDAYSLLNEKINTETERAEAAEQDLTDKIGTGFTSDPHENVTAKFNELTEKIADEETRATGEEARIEVKIDEEIARSTAKDNELDSKIDAEITRAETAENALDGKIEAIESEIGDGFGPRNTVRDEINSLQSEIDSISADSASSLKEIVNIDHSINVDNTDSTKPVIKVNLSREEEDGKVNIIKLNNDGLYAGVDLDYVEEANKLIFKTTNGSKEIQLEGMSSIIDIRYDSNKEAIIITYLTNGHEVKTVEIPVGDLINEWRVWDGHEGAVQLEKIRIPSGTTAQDILKASVVISSTHDDNILINDEGELYVPGGRITSLEGRMNSAESDITSLESGLTAEIQRAKDAEHTLDDKINSEIYDVENAILAEKNRALSAETSLQNAINDETERATYAESGLQNALNSETSSRISKDNDLTDAINSEISRSTAKDEQLYQLIIDESNRATEKDAELYEKIADEKAARETYDAGLDAKIDTEKSRAQVAENTISGMLISEISSRENAVSNLSDSLNEEIAARQSGDTALRDAINAATLEFSSTTSVKLEKDTNNKVTAKVKLANTPDNIILIDNGESGKEGLYASVKVTYTAATNTLTFSLNGVDTNYTLAGGSLIEEARYDSATKTIIFKLKNSSGEPLPDVVIPVGDLFNEWKVVNPPTNSAVELTKVTGITNPLTGEPEPDELSGRVLISPLSDNMLTMDTNGLYVCGSGATIAACVDKKVDKVYKLLYGEGAGIDNCGDDTSYIKGTGCIISAATSFSEADQMLNDAFCSFIDDWEVYGFDTPSTHTDWMKIGQNRHMLVDVRLSHGLNSYEPSGMTDEELVMNDFSGGYIEPNVSGFTDTNVLRIVNITESKSGEPLSADNKYNGVYLSNVWDCGMYYGITEADIAAKTMAEEAGYKTDYSTDEDDSAKNYNYMNNVRQGDIPHT